MSRKAPPTGRLIIICGLLALVVLTWVAGLLALLFGVGPLAGLAINLSPDAKARLVRYSIYFFVLLLVTAWFIYLADRYVIKPVPDGHAALIDYGNGQKVISLARRVVVMPRFEKLKTIDLRPRDLNFAHEVVTQDRIKITLHVTLKWQPYAEDLDMALTANIKQEQVLRDMAQNQLTKDVNHLSLDDVQGNLGTLAFHIMRFLAYREPPLDCARLYGIALLEAKIVRLDLPLDLIEVNKDKKIAELRKKYGPTQPGVSSS